MKKHTRALLGVTAVAAIIGVLVGGAISAGGDAEASASPVDALPDLSDVQVIIKTNYPGQAPQVVEDQVTYPISSKMLSVVSSRS